MFPNYKVCRFIVWVMIFTRNLCCNKKYLWLMTRRTVIVTPLVFGRIHTACLYTHFLLLSDS